MFFFKGNDEIFLDRKKTLRNELIKEMKKKFSYPKRTIELCLSKLLISIACGKTKEFFLKDLKKLYLKFE